MNIDEHPAIPGQMGIQSIPGPSSPSSTASPPTVFMGAVPESQGQRFHRFKVTKGHAWWRARPNVAEILKEARSGSGGGRSPPPPRKFMAEVLAADPTNIAALAGARQMLRRDRRHRAGQADAGHGAGNRSATIRQSRPCRRRSTLSRTGQGGWPPVSELEQKSRGKPARSSGAIRPRDPR